METLTAFVRERARWTEPSIGASETMARFYESDQPTEFPSLPTDIAAVLTVIKRRGAANRAREEKEKWCLDLNGCDLRAADLSEAHLERAILIGAHLERAFLVGAHLEDAFLAGAHLEDALLGNTILHRADLTSSKGITQEQLDRACGTNVQLDPPLTIKPCPKPPQ